ncbi:hypothetical protein HDK77DRAFT_474145 [Phyllosticta capitalensis]
MSKYLTKTDDKKRGQRKKAGTDSSGSEYAPTQGNALGGQDPGPRRKSSRTREKSEAKRDGASSKAKRVQKDPSRGRGRGRGGKNSTSRKINNSSPSRGADAPGVAMHRCPPHFNTLETRANVFQHPPHFNYYTENTGQPTTGHDSSTSNISRKFLVSGSSPLDPILLHGLPTADSRSPSQRRDSNGHFEGLVLAGAFPTVRAGAPATSNQAHGDAVDTMNELDQLLNGPRVAFNDDNAKRHLEGLPLAVGSPTM